MTTTDPNAGIKRLLRDADSTIVKLTAEVKRLREDNERLAVANESLAQRLNDAREWWNVK